MPLNLDSLDDGMLAAASSPGLLRRARADLKAGAARVLHQDAQGAQIELPDARVTLGAGGLAAARCTCPAGDICRHILAAILLLREAPAAAHGGEPAVTEAAAADPVAADPVAEILTLTQAQLKKAFGAAALARAARALPAPEALSITRSGAICVVLMEGCPEVRFVAGLGIPGMRVAASREDSRRLCAQALLAVRRAHQQALPAAAAPRERPMSPQAAALLDRAAGLVIDWARFGLSAAPEPLQERLLETAIAARAAGLYRLGSALRRLAEDVRRRRSRTSELQPLASLRAASRSFALLEALRRHPRDPELRGRARDSFEPLGEEVTLIGCGYEIWRTAGGARGVTGHFYAPAARRWLSAQLARGAGQDVSFVPEQAAQRTAVWGATLERLCVSEVTLKNAAVSPQGRLSLSTQSRAQLRSLTLKRGDISAWAGSFADWSVLDAFVRARLGPGLRGMHRGVEVAALLPARTGRPAFDEIAQELVLPLLDRQGRALPLRVANQPHLAQRLMALQEILAAKSPEVFFVSLALAGERLSISPYALLIDSGGTPWPLDAQRTHERPEGLRTIGEWLTRELEQLGAQPPPAAASATLGLLAAALDALLGLCELGGRMQDPALLAKIGALARRLEDAGLTPGAQLLAQVAQAAEPERPRAVLVAAHALHGLAELLRLPIA